MPESHVSRPEPDTEETTVEQLPVPLSEYHNKSEDKPDDEELERLRKLLFQKEIVRIEALEKRQEKPEQLSAISDIIAEAVVMRSAKDQMLSKALEPIVEDSLKDALRKHPEEFTTALFPLIGSTIRKSISEMFSSMLGNFSKSLEISFSLKGLKWRLEALRSGKSFSETVLLHTLVYQIEEMFLIHNDTGLVLAHVAKENSTGKDGDMISGMLTAIQDFAQDCFNSEGGTSSLASLQMDEYTIYIERSPRVYLAYVARGTPPLEIHHKIRENLELILAECAADLPGFNGDTTPFYKASKYLHDCLDSKFVDDDKRVPLWSKIAAGILGLLILSGFVYKTYHNRLMNMAVQTIKEEPGYIFIDSSRSLRPIPWTVTFLKDDMATPVQQILEAKGYNPENINVKTIPFISYDNEIVTRRIESKLNIPENINREFENGKLTLSGQADMEWILGIREIALTTPGVMDLDMSKLVDPRFGYIEQLVSSIENTSIYFPTGRAIPVPEDIPAFNNIIRDLVELEKLAKTMGISVNLTIYGHADATGNEKINYEISQERAKTIAAKLYAEKSSIPISIYGMGADYARNGDSRTEDPGSRKIDFRVHLVRTADADQFFREIE